MRPLKKHLRRYYSLGFFLLWFSFVADVMFGFLQNSVGFSINLTVVIEFFQVVKLLAYISDKDLFAEFYR